MNKTDARLFGVFFIFSFLSYAFGSTLLSVVQDPASLPADILQQKRQVVSGGILVSVFHSFFNLGLLVIMFHAVKRVNRLVAGLYFGLSIVGTLLLAIGAILLMALLPVSEQFVLQGYGDAIAFKSVVKLGTSANFYSYQLGMAAWGLGGMMLCYLLLKGQLAPRLFPVFGTVGYLIFITGTLLELYGYPYGIVFSIPGGIFEIGLSIWLLVKGSTVPGNLKSVYSV